MLPARLPNRPSAYLSAYNALKCTQAFSFQELRAAFKREFGTNNATGRLLLSAAVAAEQSAIDSAYEIPSIVR